MGVTAIRKTVALAIIALACLIGALTVALGLQLAYDVATHPGVINDAMTLLPMFGLPLVVIVLLAVVGRGLLKGR